MHVGLISRWVRGHGAGVILLDTHALVWPAGDPDRLSAAAREAIDADPARVVW